MGSAKHRPPLLRGIKRAPPMHAWKARHQKTADVPVRLPGSASGFVHHPKGINIKWFLSSLFNLGPRPFRPIGVYRISVNGGYRFP